MARTKKTTLRLPGQEISDRGAIRLGNGTITGNFPPVQGWKQDAVEGKTERRDGAAISDFPTLRLSPPTVTGRGSVRLGNGTISGCFPARD